MSDPVAWCHERIGEHLWSKQRQVAAAVAQHRRVAVRSCHGVGKSFLAARLACWWLDIHDPGEAFVVTTAPTFPQVRAILWREIGRAHRKAGLPGRVNQTEWWIGDELVAFGRKPSDYDESAFQGLHARHVLVILDEACGIPAELWTAAGALITNEGCRILAIGNPDNPAANFAKVCTPGSGWHVESIAASESPNFTGEDIPDEIRPLLVSQLYLDDLVADGCGPGTPVWAAKVDGTFPQDTEDGVVPLSKARLCQVPDQDPGDQTCSELGVDVGAGGDQSVIVHRHGRRARPLLRHRSPDTMELVGAVVQAIAETGATRVKVDKTGIGQGVVDRLLELRRDGVHQADIVGVMVGVTSPHTHRFPRLRDQMWWEIGRLNTEQQAWDLSDLDDATIVQLCAPRYSLDSAGRIKVEPKTETKKRLGRSPDDADALLLAFHEPQARPARMVYRPTRRR